MDRERDGRPDQGPSSVLPMGCLHHGTLTVLANALYFKGMWERKFDACLTLGEAFFLHDGCVVRVTFMSSTSK